MLILNKLLFTATVFSLFQMGEGSAFGAALISWNTSGNNGNESQEVSVAKDPGVLTSILTRGAGLVASVNTNRFGSGGWFDTGDSNPTTLAESVAGNDYIQFTVTPAAGFMISVESLSFIWDFSVTSNSGPNSVTLRSSADGYASDLGSVIGMTMGALTTFQTLSITGQASFSSAVTFRLYGYGATAAGTSAGFDSDGGTTPNVVLNGTAALVPEPSAAVALAGGLGMLMAMRRFRAAARA